MKHQDIEWTIDQQASNDLVFVVNGKHPLFDYIRVRRCPDDDLVIEYDYRTVPGFPKRDRQIWMPSVEHAQEWAQQYSNYLEREDEEVRIEIEEMKNKNPSSVELPTLANFDNRRVSL